MKNLKEKLGFNIKQERLKLGFSQEELAEKIGIAVNNLGKIERGENFVTAETLEKIINIFNILPKDLFDFGLQISNEQKKKELISAIENDKNVDTLYKFYKCCK